MYNRFTNFLLITPETASLFQNDLLSLKVDAFYKKPVHFVLQNAQSGLIKVGYLPTYFKDLADIKIEY